jgi:hypothetical protein
MAYLLDANVFIAAKNLHYGFDFCPAFWDWLIEKRDAGIVFTVEKVRDEVLAVADELSDWIDQRDPSFVSPGRRIAVSFPGRGQRVGNRQPLRAAGGQHISSGCRLLPDRSGARGGHTVVTHEVPSASTRKIKIPDACIGLGIDFMTPYQMLRRERARFVLGPSSAA